MKDLLNLVELVIMLRMLYVALRFIIKSHGKRRKGILSKVLLLGSNSIHRKLDKALETQNKRAAQAKWQAQKNVYDMAKYQRRKTN